MLLVGSDGEARDRLGGWLADAGYDVIECGGPASADGCIGMRTGSCALAHAAEVVVVDGTPSDDLDALPVIALTGLYRALGLPVVLLADEEDRLNGGGAAALLPRNPHRDHLIASVRTLAKGRPDGHDPAG